MHRRTACEHHLAPHPPHQEGVQFWRKHAIVGFTTFYHQHGSLRDLLPQLRIHDNLRREDQFKWSIQVIQALEHLRTRSSTYYPDLRLDNLVMSKNYDVVMVDFEQRGVWCEFAAPEVNAIEYMRLIAADDRLPSEVSSKYQGIMRALVPDYDHLQEDQYANPQHGYNASWIALNPEEQEVAEVYMLGRLLWCIFEGVSGPQKAAVWQSYRWESNLEFPEYDRTPPVLRSSLTVAPGEGDQILAASLSDSRVTCCCVTGSARITTPVKSRMPQWLIG